MSDMMSSMKTSWELTARSLEKELNEVRKGIVEVLETRVCKECGAVDTDINWKQLCYRLIDVINTKAEQDLYWEPPFAAQEAPPVESCEDRGYCDCGYCDEQDWGVVV
jgi:hypothetical protein